MLFTATWRSKAVLSTWSDRLESVVVRNNDVGTLCLQRGRQALHPKGGRTGSNPGGAPWTWCDLCTPYELQRQASPPTRAQGSSCTVQMLTRRLISATPGLTIELTKRVRMSLSEIATFLLGASVAYMA